ncbi:phage tail protein [Geobacillus thermoleovorans]|nr:phage tail protein [Geobacillus thermoleovorans]
MKKVRYTGNLGLKKPEGTDVVNIDDLNQNFDILDIEVVKVASPTQNGRMSAADKVKLDGIEPGAQRNTVTSVNGKTGAVSLTASDVGASPTGHTHAFAEITSKPTTLSGYGITDAIPASQKGAANGVASLDGSTKVPTSQLPTASTNAPGIVQLNDTVSSTSTTQAATANAVKQVNDAVVAHSADTATGAHKAKNIAVEDLNNRFTATDVEGVLNELFTFANNGKSSIAAVIGSPATSGDTFSQLQTHIQNAKNTMATNLTAKGVSASGTEALQVLASKIENVNTGKRWAKGTSFMPNGSPYSFTVSGLNFTPKTVIAVATGDTTGYGMAVAKDLSAYSKNPSWFLNTPTNATLTINSDGFTLFSAGRYGVNYDWIAFE